MRTSLLILAAAGWFIVGSDGGAQAQQAQVQAPAQSGSAVAAPGSTPVTAWCSGGSQPCTATATCPANTSIVNGHWWYIVPDGTGAAFGICSTNSGTCVSGQTSCAFSTSQAGCGSPGWWRQIGFLYATCR